MWVYQTEYTTLTFEDPWGQEMIAQCRRVLDWAWIEPTDQQTTYDTGYAVIDVVIWEDLDGNKYKAIPPTDNFGGTRYVSLHRPTQILHPRLDSRTLLDGEPFYGFEDLEG